jgi:hypothetical protein
MPKISLWSPYKTNDYKFIDQIAGEVTDLGATGCYVHKYVGPKLEDGDTRDVTETTIQDVLFLENRERNYDDEIYELRGHYDPSDRDFDLTQFGLMFSDDTLQLVFHLSNMVDRLGRKIMSGDVIELPHLRELYPLDEERGAVNRYYVVEDAANYGQGYGPRWWSHFWRVRLKLISDSTEFRDIIGDGSEEGDIRNELSTWCKQQEITDGIIEEAAENVPYDPVYFQAEHYYIGVMEDGSPGVFWKGDDVIPDNGCPLAGEGDAFPEDLQDGEYFLRTDFDPYRLFRKEGSCFRNVEKDRRVEWTGTNKSIDTFINNDNITKNTDGTLTDEKVALSKVVRPKDE